MATRTFATGTTTSWNTGNTLSSSSNNSIGVWRHGAHWWLAHGQHPEQCREASDRERFRWLSDRCRISTVSAGCQRAPADGQITWSPVGNVRIVCNDINDVAVEFQGPLYSVMILKQWELCAGGVVQILISTCVHWTVIETISVQISELSTTASTSQSFCMSASWWHPTSVCSSGYG